MVSPRQTLSRRQAMTGTLLLSLPLLASAPARAADWPERPIRMIIPFAAGAGADTVGRTFGEELAKALGQPVVIDNKGGAGGLLGTAEGARAPADGYTLLLTSQGATVFNMGLYKSPGYDPLKDLIPIATTGILTNVMVVSTANPANTVADVIAQARAKPGELTYGSSGVGSSLHMSGVILEQRTGVKLQHVPYRGAPAAVLAVMNGEVTMGFFNAPTVVGQIKAGKLKALAVTTKDRSVIMPEVLTMMEAGVPDFVVATWLGFAVPNGTPAPIVARLNAEIGRIAQMPQVKEKLLVQGFEVLPPDTPAAARKLIVDDQALWLPIIKQSGATAE
ncbi:tripartite tricarboxylate transporter substrate-binding protein [uncultured Reyranella sp.]|uniref:Bug family tripartite tricarboxylate transporter substrate binding protein n=1 Tax=uncultured Reyranella sp. TaxID=735512 RepID=UPI00259CA7D4|nr:tripartite tricarboxylate transporter substrate-binding protein [uncultured Reyranella sp.]